VDESNPATWSSTGWHSDWDGDWQFDQLRTLATQFLGSPHSTSRSVKLETINNGYVRVAFYDGNRCLGISYANRAGTHPDATPSYVVYFGGDDDEIETTSIADAIASLAQAQGHWEHEPET
jgi:hypothetical protein